MKVTINFIPNTCTDYNAWLRRFAGISSETIEKRILELRMRAARKFVGREFADNISAEHAVVNFCKRADFPLDMFTEMLFGKVKYPYTIKRFDIDITIDIK